ncbi:MAG: cysteine--tRNA ligase [Phycisphaerae bacterium]|nr:cysteine--tRNA ligase [Phycisphaerae bacterium]
MQLKLYNTLTRTKDAFEPIDPPEVKLYTCGPTVYNYAHIGNLRTYVFEDVLKRTLVHVGGYDVSHVMNVTDVGHLVSDADAGEDKMAVGARREGKTVWEIAQFYWDAFRSDLARLNCIEPDTWCRATDEIDAQIDLVRKLEENGHTYTIDDGVYFDTSKLDDYGKLAQLDLEGLQAGARVEMTAGKRNPTDFALWKFSPKDQQRLMEWPSPWGVGFPGWHIECSAMAIKHLGERLDIHCGGVDHVNVHHTNEIAQAECALGHKWCNWWLHGEFLTMPTGDESEGGRMSKSSGEFLTLDKLVERGYAPVAYRYFLLQAHYRQQLAFSWDALAAAATAIDRLRRLVCELRPDEQSQGRDADDTSARPLSQPLAEFHAAAADDLNTPRALAAMWNAARDAGADAARRYATLVEMDKVLGLGIEQMEEEDNTRSYSPDELATGNAPSDLNAAIEQLIRIDRDMQAQLAQDRSHGNQESERAQELNNLRTQQVNGLLVMRFNARRQGDYAAADRIREALEAIGFSVEDKPGGGTTLQESGP